MKSEKSEPFTWTSDPGDTGGPGMGSTLFWRNVAGGLRHVRSTEVNTATPMDEVVGSFDETLFTFRYSRNGGDHGVYRTGDSLVLATFWGGTRIHFTVAAKTGERADLLLADLVLRCPEREVVTDGSVSMQFWMNSPTGPSSHVRPIEASCWADVAGNYPTGTRGRLEQLVNFEPGAGGKLILWHGPPGVGKTTVLRAMAREWAKWCRVHYVIDPESFFGQASYLMQVLLDEEPDLWRLLVLEDTDEFLSRDAKSRTGQALSRLLNVTDGIVGQGLRVLVLITTNEEPGSLHPAVVRDGRCIAHIEFPKFQPAEANQWLKEHGVDGAVSSERTLAELYEQSRPEHIESRPLELRSGVYL